MVRNVYLRSQTAEQANTNMNTTTEHQTQALNAEHSVSEHWTTIDAERSDYLNRVCQKCYIFAEHIGLSDNQLLFGVLESVFYSLFRTMAGLLARILGAESFTPT